MRVRKEPKPISVECIDCGEIFIAYSKKALRCPICRKLRQRQQHKQYLQEEYGMETIPANKSKAFRPKMTMREVLKEQEAYNRLHKTHYTYGQFVEILEGKKWN